MVFGTQAEKLPRQAAEEAPLWVGHWSSLEIPGSNQAVFAIAEYMADLGRV